MLNFYKYFNDFKHFLPWERAADHNHVWPIFGKYGPRLQIFKHVGILAFAPHEQVAFSAFWPLTQPSVYFFLIAPISARPEVVKSLKREAKLNFQLALFCKKISNRAHSQNGWKSSLEAGGHEKTISFPFLSLLFLFNLLFLFSSLKNEKRGGERRKKWACRHHTARLLHFISWRLYEWVTDLWSSLKNWKNNRAE